jgi:hypothetical protein
LRQRRAEAAAEYAKLMVQFEPGYPAARALEEQIRALDNSIAREESRVTGRDSGRARSGLTAEYQAAVRRENELQSKFNAIRTKLSLEQRNTIQYNIYQREADTNRELYDGMLQSYREIGVAGVGVSNIAVVDTAKIPGGPSAPNMPMNLAVSLLVGLGLAAFATIALDQIDEGLREPGQVNRMLHVPLLGSVPDAGDDDTLALLADAKSSLSEAYLSIRSNLAFSTDHGVPKSFMVTSTRPAEGKSTSSLALAIVLTRTGKKVLLIDGDMRSPSIHEYTGMKNTLGLSNILAGENEWRPFIHAVKDSKLSIMSAGPTPPSAAELLSSDRMSLLIQQSLIRRRSLASPTHHCCHAQSKGALSLSKQRALRCAGSKHHLAVCNRCTPMSLALF